MRGAEHNLSVRSAYLHILGDSLSSVGVVVAGILIMVTGDYVFDPIISLLIGALIILSSFSMLKESVYILMEATPSDIDIKEVEKDILKVPLVREVYDLHIWYLSSDVRSLSTHMVIDSEDTNSLNDMISQVNESLRSKYGITHTVIQAECERCADSGNNKICKR